MPEITSEAAIDQICTHVRSQTERYQPYALILGSGASVPVIPSTRDMIDWILWWGHCVLQPPETVDALFNRGPTPSDQFEEYRAQFLRTLLPIGKAIETLDADEISDLYSKLNGRNGVLFQDDRRTSFMRAICRRAGLAVNDTHLLLASILMAGESSALPRPLWQTIFTTNFDPLLQRSLQLFNLLYRVVDRPDTLSVDLDNSTLRLVYCHGSIHSYVLANEERLRTHAQVHAQQIQAYLEQRGVIVLGYAGWPGDVLMTALQSIDRHAGSLYWCDIVPSAKGLRADVRTLLSRGDRHFVPLGERGAAGFLGDLHKRLNLGAIPSFLQDPLKGLVEELNQIKVSGVDTKKEPESLAEALQQAVTRLKAAHLAYTSPADMSASTQAGTEALRSATLAEIRSRADASFTEMKFPRAVELYSQIIEAKDATAEEKAKARLARGWAHREHNNRSYARNDFDCVAETDGLSDELRAIALMGQGRLSLEQEDARDAERLFGRALRFRQVSQERQIEARVLRGRARLELRKWTGAARDFEDSLRLGTDLPEWRQVSVRLDLARALARTKARRGEAVDLLRSILSTQRASNHESISALLLLRGLDIWEADSAERLKALLKDGSISLGLRREAWATLRQHYEEAGASHEMRLCDGEIARAEQDEEEDVKTRMATAASRRQRGGKARQRG